MSCNREFVVWQSPDKSWNVGFFSYCDVGREGNPDWDYEWDVEYLYDSFFWASTGHRSPVEAALAWRNANPGSANEVIEYKRGATVQCRKYDEMVQCLRDPAVAARVQRREHRKQMRAVAKR